MVYDFVYVFSNIPRLPPMREAKFNIDLIPGITFIYRAPYCMAFKNMEELRV